MKFFQFEDDIIIQIAKEAQLPKEDVRQQWNDSLAMSKKIQLSHPEYPQIDPREAAIVYTRLMCQLEPKHPFSLFQRIIRSFRRL